MTASSGGGGGSGPNLPLAVANSTTTGTSASGLINGPTVDYSPTAALEIPIKRVAFISESQIISQLPERETLIVDGCSDRDTPLEPIMSNLSISCDGDDLKVRHCQDRLPLPLPYTVIIETHNDL